MTRVLVVEPSGNLWGSERALLDLLDGLEGVEVAVCCPPNRPLEAELTKRSLRVLPHFVYALHEKSRLHRLWAAIGVIRACIEFRPEVLHLNQGGAYRVALPAAQLFNLPIVAHIRIFEDADYIARQRPHPTRVRGLIAISAAVEAVLRRFPELELIPIHRLYDCYRFDSSMTSSKRRLRNRIACVGRLAPIKGQEVLIRAMRLVANDRNDVECLIVGDGDQGYAQSLRRVAIEEGVEASIRWHGAGLDVLPILRTASVLTCPSHREPLGRVIFEAWDAGAVPVVFSGSGGAAEVVGEACGGLLYDEQSPQSLAHVLKKALALDRERADSMIENGRLWASDCCNPKTYAEAVCKILSDAISYQSARKN